MLAVLTPRTRPLFEAAGWTESRCVTVDPAVSREHPAFRFLQSFGGLHVGGVGKGVECAASDIAFGYCHQDPEYLNVMQQDLSTDLLAVGDVHNTHGWIILDSAGRCFGASQFHRAFWYTAETVALGIELGYRDRPMLLPNQDEVDLYGKTFRRGDPAIFDPKT